MKTSSGPLLNQFILKTISDLRRISSALATKWWHKLGQFGTFISNREMSPAPGLSSEQAGNHRLLGHDPPSPCNAVAWIMCTKNNTCHLWLKCSCGEFHEGCRSFLQYFHFLCVLHHHHNHHITSRATTTNQPTNRAPNEPACPGPNWPKMPILGQIWSFLGKKS